MRHERTVRGFTLVELCSVLVIVGILGALAGPRLLDTPAFGQRGYTDELAGAIRSSEAAAAATGCDVQLSITPGTGYDAELPATATCSGGYTVPVSKIDGTPLAGTPPANADVSAPVVLLLDPKGPIAGGTSIQVVGPPSAGSATLQLDIDPLSGFVTVP